MRRPKRKKRFKGRVIKENPHKINLEIRSLNVRLVGDPEQHKIGVMPTRKAYEIASEMELDLVEISPNADPPVAKILDYKKFLYEQKKKQKELKARQSKVVVKEIRFGPNTDDHDFNFKLDHARKFLQEGSKVKAYVFFRGRSILFKNKGEIILLRLATELEEVGVVEMMPKMEGKKMNMIIQPKKKN